MKKKDKRDTRYGVLHETLTATIPIDGKYQPYKQNLKPTSGKMEDYNSVRV